MNRVKWLSICLAICLMCAISLAAMAEEDVACPPVDEAVGEVDSYDLMGEAPEGLPLVGEAVADAVNPLESDLSPFIIEDGVLTGYMGLDNVIDIPEGVTRIGYGVFEEDRNLISVTIPSSVTAIEDRAFYNCDSLTNVAIPDSVTEIGGYAFSSCDSLTTIELPANLKEIPAGMFWYCSKLEHITIPGTAIAIGNRAFGSCRQLKKVVIRNGVQFIEDAFNSCIALESVSIPPSVTQINRTTFNNCDNLVILGEEGSTAEQYARLIGVPFNAPIITFDESAIWLHISRTRTLVATQRPAELTTDLVWSSSNEGVVSVAQDGTIRALATGEAVITVNSADGAGRAGMITVVVPPPSGIKLSAVDVNYFTVGQSTQVIASVSTPYAQPTDIPFTVKWMTSDSSIIAIDNVIQAGTENPKAIIRGVGVGTGIIAAVTDDGGVGTIAINVHQPEPMGIAIDQPNPVWMHAGEMLQLTVTLTPAQAVSANDWYSLDEEIISVNQNGLVTARAVGTGTIRVETYNDFEDEIDIIVIPQEPSAMRLSRSGTVSLALGKTLQLNAIMEPTGAQSKLKWKSSNKQIAKVSSSGKVTPVKTGTATITVKTANGLEDSVKIKVVAPEPKSVSITNGDSVRLAAGKTLKLKVKFSPEYARSNLTWISSNKNVATVSENGVVTAKKPGMAVIVVKTENGKRTSITINVK